MKVKELIERLNKLDPEMLVLVSGYEDGFEPIYARNISVMELIDGGKVKRHWWSGRYQTGSGPKKVKALVIAR